MLNNENISRISKLLLSAAIFLFSISALIFVFRFGSHEAHAVGVAKQGRLIYTQSSNGKTLYMWRANQQTREYEFTAYSKQK